MGKAIFVLALLLTAVVLVTPALADKRVALVIGNGGYRSVEGLPNPPRDAAAIGALFQNARFDDVRIETDLSVAGMRRALRDFADRAADADIAVVFYAGHGIELGGRNYLAPVDATLATDFAVEDETIALDRVLQALESVKRLKLVILDACRDNPFAARMRRTTASRSIGRGLAAPESQTGDTLVAYAARAGSIAADGDGANSPFTAALLRHLTTPGLDIRIALGKVRDDVLATTGRRQEPYLYGSLGGGNLTLAPGSGVAPTLDTRPTIAAPLAPTPQHSDVPLQPPVAKDGGPAKPKVRSNPTSGKATTYGDGSPIISNVGGNAQPSPHFFTRARTFD